MSVQAILQRLQQENGWKINVAQRAFEWSPRKIADLIDSMLRGFPIGSVLILKDSTMEYYDFSQRDSLRELKATPKRKTDQIIDGQQRCYSFKITYGGEGFQGSDGDPLYLWLNLGAYNQEYREFDRTRSHKFHLHWSARQDLNQLADIDRAEEGMRHDSPRSGWYRFDRLVSHDFGGAIQKVCKDSGLDLRETGDTVSEILSSVDRSFQYSIVPVDYMPESEDSIQDIFHVFIRINTGGKNLNDTDIFFTGVKKYWRDAEFHLANLLSTGSLFDRRSAITLLGRMAAMSFDRSAGDPAPSDPVRLNLSHLRSSNSDPDDPYPLIKGMEHLSQAESSLCAAIEWVDQVVREAFKVGAQTIHKMNLMTIVAWVYQVHLRNGVLPTKDETVLRPILSFLFWGVLFGPHVTGRESFFRHTLDLAWRAGTSGAAFPYKVPEFSRWFLYNRVTNIAPRNPFIESFHVPARDDPAYGDVKKMLDLMKWSAGFVLAEFQRAEHHSMDIDHVIALNYARPRLGTGRRYTEEQRDHHFYWIDTIGNYALISASANRAYQDIAPSKKLHSKSKGYFDESYVRTDPMINSEDTAIIVQIESILNEHHTKRDREKAARLFQEFVTNRAFRMWSRALQKYDYPEALLKQQ